MAHPMEVQVAALCDFAADYGGKLCVVGVFDTVVAPSFPIKRAHCYIALRILFRDDDRGRHLLKFSLIDEDGCNLLPKLGGEMNVALPDHLFFLSTNVCLNLQGIEFKRPGQYSIDISVDDKMIARIPLQVVLLQPPPALA
ncbi:MAG: hypothetical protein FJ386_03820 [Verrucomicrobia bacterium]|nr:hypothetical protein [Verrucomicrobiota bacterium]